MQRDLASPDQRHLGGEQYEPAGEDRRVDVDARHAGHTFGARHAWLIPPSRFMLPDSEIRPTGAEQLASLKVFARAVLGSAARPRLPDGRSRAM